MLCVYPADCTDFSGNGLGTISPSSALVKETLNGEYELEIVHPLDENGKWQRLVEGCIVRAPVPSATTPRVALAYKEYSEGKAIYKVNTARNPLTLRSSTGSKYKKLGKYKKGKQVIVLEKTTSTLWEVVCPDGKRGYMPAASLAFVRNSSDYAEDADEVLERHQLRDQPFRIYRIVPELDKVTAYARHIFYDLLENMVKTLTALDTTIGKTVVDQLSAACLSEHDFTFYSNLSSTAEEVSYENKNPVDILLGDGGIVEKYGGELQRDWYDVFLVKRVGNDTKIQIRQGKNLTGIKYDVDLTDVVTRIMPTGEDKDGKVLYLPEIYIDSPNLANYPAPKWIHLAVPDCKEVTKGKKKKTKTKCYTQMRQAAQAEFDNGCDLPTVTLTVEFIDVTQTEEYKQYKFLRSIYLGDAVRVIARRVGVEVSMRMTEYTYNCLTRQYEKMTLGTVEDTVGVSMISSRQLPSGIISGSKIALGSVGVGQLQEGSVGELQIQEAAIGNAHIQSAAIGAANIQTAAIEFAHIASATINSLNAGAIEATTAKIASMKASDIQTDSLAAALAAFTVITCGTATFRLCDGDMLYLTTCIAPVIEEVMKALPILYFALVFSDDRKTLLSISYAMGLGFAMLENMMILTDSLSGVTILWAFIRGFGAARMHSACTAMVGRGIAYVRKRRKLFYCGTLSLLVTAIIIHALFNTLVQSEHRELALVMVMLMYMPHIIRGIRRLSGWKHAAGDENHTA